jgi:hypothetical protein
MFFNIFSIHPNWFIMFMYILNMSI